MQGIHRLAKSEIDRADFRTETESAALTGTASLSFFISSLFFFFFP